MHHRRRRHVTDKGAHFFRTDLQVHTPRDRNFAGSSATTEAERLAYAQSLVAACRERGLSAIAVTDHHDMAFVPFVRRAAADETDSTGQPVPQPDQIVVFPGMELTLAVPCQALVIFDADFPEDLFALVLNALAIVPAPATSLRAAPVQRLNVQSLQDLKENLDKHTFLKGRYIVLPHVGEKGQFSLLRKGQAIKYIEMPCVGGYVDGSLDKLGEGNRGILAGTTKEWGNKRIACFQTSDSRSADHQELGKYTTWVKWAVPTAEGLRQACLAQESRISQDPPRLPSLVLESLSVSNSAFLGPIELELNPQYTALIGGRGTGKSTILEYLRWALCDQPPSALDVELPNYQGRRVRLIEQTLQPVGAKVQVQFSLNGVRHVVRRDSADGSVAIRIGSDEMRPCTEEEVRGLLPIQAYSQKQLSDVSVRVEELSRFITTPIRGELEAIDRSLAERAERLRQSHATQQRRRGLRETLEARELEERSLTEQATALRASLGGLSDQDRSTIDGSSVFESGQRAVESWRGGILAIREAARAMLGVLGRRRADTGDVPVEPDEPALREIHDAYAALLNDAESALNGIEAQADGLLGEPAAGVEPGAFQRWAARYGEYRARYEAAAQRSSAHRERLQELQRVDELLARHIRESARVSDELNELAHAEREYSRERTAWEAQLQGRQALIERECTLLTERSAGAIRARVERLANAADFAARLRLQLSGSRVPAARIDRLATYIVEGGPDAESRWHSVLDELEQLAQFDADRTGIEKTPQVPTLLAAGLSRSDVDRIARVLRPEGWFSLSVTPIESVPVFEYRVDETEYIQFANASAGQQATALLKTLLNQEGPPLIIDQPEEDLDNRVMLEIVEQVWTAKQGRQLIFASHNANLVVNGDAELVVWCEHRTAGDQSRGTIAGEGAIDVAEVREAIKEIMEGGEEAFKLRRQKYGF